MNEGLALGWQDNGAAEVVGGTVFYLVDVAEVVMVMEQRSACGFD